jgi:predicted DNA-binding antitoxin AbrB/MazE fold protein
MQVEAIYDHGKLKFISPVRLKVERLKVLVTVPDDEIEIDTAYNIPQEVIDRAKALLARMEDIKNAPLPPDEDLPELTEKQRGRIEAFSLRDEIKGLRSS